MLVREGFTRPPAHGLSQRQRAQPYAWLIILHWLYGRKQRAGRQKTAMCQGCHGIPGYKTAFPAVYHVPKLGGQHAGYLVKALQAYKSGERSHPSMKGIAAGLSDKDMADLAAYYAAQDTKTSGK